jgi:single-strand DNA-binding protein
MGTINKVVLVGRLAQDNDLKQVGKDNMPVVNNAIALDGRKKGTDEAIFIDLTAFGKQAELMAEYTGKGSSVGIEGRLSVDRWEDKEGNPRRKTKVIAERVTFLGKPKSEQSDASPF